jgi:F-type H+-transporting ATPase subunit gamma
MANLRDLRKRRKGAANTKKITRTMELVSSAKLKKAQDAAAASRPYAEGLRQLMSELAAAAGGVSHPLMAKRAPKVVRILLACSDRGLAGAFNANLAALALKRAAEHRAKGYTVEFVALSKKAASTLRFNGMTPVSAHSGLIGATKYAQAEPLADDAIQRFLDKQVDVVEVVYSRFISAARQVPDLLVLLPAGGDAGGGVTAATPFATTGAGRKPQYEFIPDAEELLTALVPQVIKTALFSAMLQTSAAEHAARRVAMKNATDAANDMVKALGGAYNRGRQAKITQEIAEITGAVEAMA